MAKLIGTLFPEKNYDDPNYWGRDFEANKTLDEQRMNDMRMISKKATETNLLGYMFEQPYADGKAAYVVTKDDGKTIELKHVNLFDAYALPAAHVRGLNRQDIVNEMRYSRHFNAKK